MDTTTAEAEIKFQKHHLVMGETKIGVSYHLDNRGGDKRCVTIYDRDYGSALFQFFPDEYQNDTDSQTDYFAHARATLFEGHPHYAAARARAEQNDRTWKEKRAVSDKITIRPFYRAHKCKPRGRGTWVIQQASNYTALVADLVGQPEVFNGSLEAAKRQAVAKWPEAKFLAILP